MKTDERRGILRTGARLAAAAALGALGVTIGLRRRGKDTKEAGYCNRAGRCGGCDVTETCDVFQDMHGGPAHGR